MGGYSGWMNARMGGCLERGGGNGGREKEDREGKDEGGFYLNSLTHWCRGTEASPSIRQHLSIKPSAKPSIKPSVKTRGHRGYLATSKCKDVWGDALGQKTIQPGRLRSHTCGMICSTKHRPFLFTQRAYVNKSLRHTPPSVVCRSAPIAALPLVPLCSMRHPKPCAAMCHALPSPLPASRHALPCAVCALRRTKPYAMPLQPCNLRRPAPCQPCPLPALCRALPCPRHRPFPCVTLRLNRLDPLNVCCPMLCAALRHAPPSAFRYCPLAPYAVRCLILCATCCPAPYTAQFHAPPCALRLASPCALRHPAPCVALRCVSSCAMHRPAPCVAMQSSLLCPLHHLASLAIVWHVPPYTVPSPAPYADLCPALP